MASPTPVTIYEDRDTEQTAAPAARGYLAQKRARSSTIWAVQSTATGRFTLSEATSEPSGVLLPALTTATAGRFVLTTASSEVRNYEFQGLGNGRFAVNDGDSVVTTVTNVWGISVRANEAGGRFIVTGTGGSAVGIQAGSATTGKMALVDGDKTMITVLPVAT